MVTFHLTWNGDSSRYSLTLALYSTSSSFELLSISYSDDSFATSSSLPVMDQYGCFVDVHSYHKPCLLTKPVENAAACLAIDGVALSPKTAGVLDALTATLGRARGAERAICLRENIV